MKIRQLRRWLARLFGSFNRMQREREFAEELESHLALHTEDNLRAGMSLEEARRAAILKLGGVTLTQENYRDQRGIPMFDTLWQDLCYGLRMLLKHKGFTAVAVMTFALGMGVNTVVFSMVYRMLFQALPYPNVERLAAISQTSRQNVEFGVSYPEFSVWKEQNTVFERMAASRMANVNLTSSYPVKRVAGAYISEEFFSLLGGRAQLGRTFFAEEFRPGAEKAVILSYGFWLDNFEGDAAVIGRTLQFDGQNYTIIGVMPPSFPYPFRAKFWTTFEASEQAKNLQDASANNYEIIGLLRQGVSLERATQEIAGLKQRASGQRPAGLPELSVQVRRFEDTLPGLTKYRTPLLTLQLAVLFVLMIAIVNLANLILARNTARRREFATRLALGASRWRLMRQLLIESLFPGLLGSAFGILFAAWGMHLARAFGDLQIPGVGEIEINTGVLFISLLVSLLTSLFFGLVPAFVTARQDLIECLKTCVAVADPRQQRLSGAMVVAEIALAVALLTGSGLMIRTFLNLTRVDPGFKTERAIAVSLSLPSSQRRDYESVATYFDEAIRRISALPGIEAVGGVGYLPLIGYNPGVNFALAGRAASPDAASRADIQPITPGYFQAIGIPLLLGRQFTQAEMTPQPNTAIVNNTFAQKFWPAEDPLGKHILLQDETLSRAPLVVVGVVGDVKQFGLRTDPRPEIYLPLRKSSMTLVVRTSGNSARLFVSVRDAVQELDEQAAVGMRTMEDMLSRANWTPRNLALRLAALSAVALLLAGMGIYGVISYLVAQRTRELGIRLALGARRRDILQLVLKQGMKLTLVGVAIGLALSLALSRFISAQLFGVSAYDPLTFVAITLLLLSVALIASYRPARRATKVDPLISLKYE
jgi:putative ABC transport system permease protein